MKDEHFAGLHFLIQYRRKDDGVLWRSMAAFDVLDAAAAYFAKQSGDHMPWEYRLIEIVDAPDER